MGDATNDLQALAHGVGVADHCDRSRVGVLGADSAKLLHNLCTNDVQDLAPGRWCEAFFLNAKGGVLFYARLFKGDDEFRLDLEPGCSEGFVKHIDRYIIREKALVRALNAATFLIHVCGGGAEAALKNLFDTAALPGDREQAAHSNVVDGLTVARIARTPFPGFDLFGAIEVKDEVAKRLHQVAPHALSLSAEDVERLRVLAGLPAMGREIIEGSLAQEFDRNSESISFTKGCYIGQETVARLDAMGHVNKVLRGLTLESAERPADGARIRFGDKEVGVVASSAVALDGRSARCLAIIRTAASAPGVTVAIDFPAGARPALVSTLPRCD